MKRILLPIVLPFGLLLSCTSSTSTSTGQALPIVGTWRLVSGATVTKGDTSVIDYTKDISMIKIINDTHFAFLKHDVNSPADSSNHFGAGGGSYTLDGNAYTEHLDYFAERNWEGKTFNFTVSISNDTLIQSGIEKVEGAGIDHEIIERYVRVK